MRNIKEVVNDWISPVEVYEFDDYGEKKYVVTLKGGLDRRIYGTPIRKCIEEDLEIKIKKDSKYKVIPISVAKKMDFRNLDYKVSQTIDGFFSTYYELLTKEQEDRKWEEETGGMSGDFI